MNQSTVEGIAYIFIFFLLLSTILKFYLAHRQAKVLEANENEVPEYFKEKITLQEYKKAIDYSLDKLGFQQITSFFEVGIIIIFTLLGGLNFLSYLTNTITTQPILHDLILILLFGFVNYLISLPFTIYESFKLEATYGFNNSTPALFIQDQIKNLILSLILLVPLLLVILYLLQSVGQYWWFYTWLVWIAFSLVMIWVFPKWISPLFNSFKPLEDQTLQTCIENLLTKTGFQSNGVFVMDGSKRSGHANAYFTGFGKNKRIVFFDTLLEDMENQEIEAILAHELGHFKLKHILKQMVVTFILALIVLFVLGQLIQNPAFYLGLGVETQYISNGMGLILFFLVLPVVTFIFSPLGHILSRKNEYEADAFSAKTTSAKSLISALIKLYNNNAASLVTDKLYSFYYDSHPNAEDRINALEKQL